MTKRPMIIIYDLNDEEYKIIIDLKQITQDQAYDLMMSFSKIYKKEKNKEVTS
jgi:hypothetical protein